MARYAILNRIDRAEGLKAFKLDGYVYSAKESRTERLVFRRRQE